MKYVYCTLYSTISDSKIVPSSGRRKPFLDVGFDICTMQCYIKGMRRKIHFMQTAKNSCSCQFTCINAVLFKPRRKSQNWMAHCKLSQWTLYSVQYICNCTYTLHSVYNISKCSYCPACRVKVVKRVNHPHAGRSGNYMHIMHALGP